MKRSAAEILREYGPFPGADRVNGVTFDGQHVWFASGDRLNAFDPASGKVRALDRCRRACGNGLRRPAPVPDRRRSHPEDRSRRPAACWRRSRRRAAAATRASPGPKARSGWGSIATARSIRSTPQTGAILRTIESNRFVTGVTWVDGELWHGTWEGDESDVRRIDPETGEVLERLEMPPGTGVSGLESDGGDRFFCGGGNSGKVRAVRRPGRGSTNKQSRRSGKRPD